MKTILEEGGGDLGIFKNLATQNIETGVQIANGYPAKSEGYAIDMLIWDAREASAQRGESAMSKIIDQVGLRASQDDILFAVDSWVTGRVNNLSSQVTARDARSHSP